MFYHASYCGNIDFWLFQQWKVMGIFEKKKIQRTQDILVRHKNLVVLFKKHITQS